MLMLLMLSGLSGPLSPFNAESCISDTLYVCIGAVTLFGVPSTVLNISHCKPIQKAWQYGLPGTCINLRTFYVASNVLNVIFDIIIFVLPIPVVWKLKLPLRQRVLLVATFACGSIILVASAMRLHLFLELQYHASQALFLPRQLIILTAETTGGNVPMVAWSQIEVHLAILLSCVPAFKALVQRVWPHLLASLSTGSRKQNYGNKTTRRCPDHSSYALQSRGHDEHGVCTVIEPIPRNAESLDSQDLIVGSGESGWARMESAISIHSSSRESRCKAAYLVRCFVWENSPLAVSLASSTSIKNISVFVLILSQLSSTHPTMAPNRITADIDHFLPFEKPGSTAQSVLCKYCQNPRKGSFVRSGKGRLLAHLGACEAYKKHLKQLKESNGRPLR
ncbi:hypothetical protein K469DRAFT_803823 [Zopfia rhizophila CBS 207.26]|uniref:Rhodopsin domain-containing protein n=1 Tax=Zopfia rhizophila CBS 207.26 TaxID=1314779 RepID=A0A6A6DI91_9PEZI|nr:hypothetical protein K469DRAFT_803823 [Zopfia rhizophila CBS 207.26]